MILRQAGSPEEIDLVDPARPEKREENTRVEALPRAICPDGSPTSLWQVSTSDEALPGCSPIDAMSLPLNPAALQPDQDRTATPTDLPLTRLCRREVIYEPCYGYEGLGKTQDAEAAARHSRWQQRGESLRRCHFGGVGRRSDAGRCFAGVGRYVAALLPVGDTGVAGPGGGTGAAAESAAAVAGRQDCRLGKTAARGSARRVSPAGTGPCNAAQSGHPAARRRRGEDQRQGRLKTQAAVPGGPRVEGGPNTGQCYSLDRR